MRSIYVNRIESLGRSLREGASPVDDHDPGDQSPSIGVVRGCLTSVVVSCQNVGYLSFFIRNVGDDGPSSSPRGFSLPLPDAAPQPCSLVLGSSCLAKASD